VSTQPAAPVFRKSAPRRQLAAEVEALRAFGEHRAVRVHEVHLDRDLVVLERVQPGASLASETGEDEAMRVVARLIDRAWPAVPIDSVAEPMAVFARALERDAEPCRRARGLLAELLDDRVPAMLLHGDLHYENVLRSDRAGYLLIDPKGVIGEPAFDIGYLVSRPGPVARDGMPLARVIERRLAFLPGATGTDPRRVTAYAYVAAALSAAWALEDQDGSGPLYQDALRLLEPRLE
jgi:streptomycin 6-kinase